MNVDWLIIKLDPRSRFLIRNTHFYRELWTMKVKGECFAKLSEGDVCDFTSSKEKIFPKERRWEA